MHLATCASVVNHSDSIMKSLFTKTKLSLAMLALCAAGFGGTSALAGDTASVAVSAAVSGSCKFNSGGAVSFVLDPASTSDATGTVTQPAFWCTKGTAYSLSDDDGVNESGVGAQRMKHATLAEYIPYTFAYTTSGSGTGKGTPITLDIASTVVNANFVNASAGAYADTVTLTVTP